MLASYLTKPLDMIDIIMQIGALLRTAGAARADDFEDYTRGPQAQDGGSLVPSGTSHALIPSATAITRPKPRATRWATEPQRFILNLQCERNAVKGSK
jgi:hypothetical protein